MEKKEIMNGDRMVLKEIMIWHELDASKTTCSFGEGKQLLLVYKVTCGDQLLYSMQTDHNTK